MKLAHALLGMAALGGAALSAGSASATPIGLATNSGIANNVEQVRLACDVYGRCFRTAPRYYGYYGGPVVRFGYGGYRHHHHWHYGWHRW